MTTAEMLAEVETQIRKDIPRLMELREGCYLKHNIVSSIYKIYCVDHYNYRLFRPSDKEIWILSKELLEKSLLKKEIFEIIGHDIMLNDVLEWLKYLGFLTECSNINFDGNTFCKSKLIYDNDDNFLYKKTTFCEWNLSTPYLKDQSEELIKFLYNIKNKKWNN